MKPNPCIWWNWIPRWLKLGSPSSILYFLSKKKKKVLFYTPTTADRWWASLWVLWRDAYGPQHSHHYAHTHQWPSKHIKIAIITWSLSRFSYMFGWNIILTCVKQARDEWDDHVLLHGLIITIIVSLWLKLLEPNKLTEGSRICSYSELATN